MSQWGGYTLGPSDIGHDRLPDVYKISRVCILLLVVYLLASRLHDTSQASAETQLNAARQMFQSGYLEEAQRQAQQGLERFQASDPRVAARFQLIAAEAMTWRGLYDDALKTLSVPLPEPSDLGDIVHKLALESVSLTRLEKFKPAESRLKRAQALCLTQLVPACGEIPRAQGVLAMEHGAFADAEKFFKESLKFSRAIHDPRLEATALLNLGAAALQQEHFDEAGDYSTKAYRAAVGLGAEDLEQRSLGNIGWSTFKLGDRDRALSLFIEAQKHAAKLGDLLFEIKWLATIGYVDMDLGKVVEARGAYQRALETARRINSKEDVTSILMGLGQMAVVTGKPEEADTYAREGLAMAKDSGNRADQYDDVAIELQAAALRGETSRAEQLLAELRAAPESQTSMKWASEHAIATMHERRGEVAEAGTHYRAALAIFAAARAEIQKDDSELPFLTNATRIYDDYIHFLVTQGKTDEALAVADESRARTLAQGLGLTEKQHIIRPELMRSGAVARRTGATILFYWLGERQSYLWAVTPSKTQLFTLPAQAEITQSVERYRKSLLNTMKASESADGDGADLYRMLVQPAAELVRPGGNVMVVCDGPLSLLNFETLVVPSPVPHYWIEDASVTSAPSLYMLASARPARSTEHRLLLMGDAVSPNTDYPELPMASVEMTRVGKHFQAGAETVYARQAATADAYLKSIAQPYSYIHFVAHGVASRTEPLDSAIILSRTNSAEDSFKLHARDIIEHPINAQLVTISACYGGGTRSYAGEGLVGLSWAFLRAGAHNVIGALWEASDDSTPQLMDALYQGVQDGMTPSSALRQAKLGLLHSGGRFKQPFYWAPFQIYTGL